MKASAVKPQISISSQLSPFYRESKPCKTCVELKIKDIREVYLDYNSTTYIREEVIELINEYNKCKLGFGNPSSNSQQGDYASDLIWDSRAKIADCLSVNPEEIYFTGSGSEANNLAIKGIAFKHLDKKGHLITSKTEHSSVLKVMEYLETLGFSITYLDTDHEGMVSPDHVKKAIRKDTILVSIMIANNEIGTINPILKIGKICKKAKVPFMCDAIQAFGKISLNPKAMNISLLSFCGHKIYAPKGIGGLYIEKGLDLVPLVHGGGQEGGLRSGTENLGYILAFGKAAKMAHIEMGRETLRYLDFRNYFLNELKEFEPNFKVYGSLEYRIPNNLSIGFPGVDSNALVKSLEKIGISVSTGAACSSRKTNTSHVLEAIGADVEKYAIIRFSFGLKTNIQELQYVLKYLKVILPLLKEKKGV